MVPRCSGWPSLLLVHSELQPSLFFRQKKKKKKALPTLGEAISIQGGFLEKGHLSFFRIEQLLSQLQVGKRLLVPGWPGLLIGP